MENFSVEFYQKSNGERPAELFLCSLDKKMRAKAVGLIEILGEKGNELRRPYSAFLRDGIFELRIQSGSDISRILYFFFIGKRIILTHGFIKKSDKVPVAEIDAALEYRKDFMAREDEK